MLLKRHYIRSEKGFSLLEMVFVVVVAGILMAAVIPGFRHFLGTQRLAGATNELVGDLHYARSLAVKKRRAFHIEFSADEYKIVETATAEVIRTRTLPNGYTFTASADPNFYPWGLTDAINVQIAHGGSTRNLTLSANGNVTHY